MTIKDYTIKQLERELRQRMQDKLVPLDYEDVDWEKVYELILNNVRFLEDNGREEPDHEHWLWETAMVAVYGDEVWQIYNKLLRAR